MCGIVAVIYSDPASTGAAGLMYRGLIDLQPRGKEAAGIETDRGFWKDQGTPERVFLEHRFNRPFNWAGNRVSDFLLFCGIVPAYKYNLQGLGGSIGVGHVLYTTSGKGADHKTIRRRAQPFHCRLGGRKGKDIWFAFNGNLTNWEEIAEECRREGYKKPIINDTHAIAALIELAASSTLEHALKYEVLPRLQWSFSIVFHDVSERVLYAVRDRRGFMPLFIGRRGREFWVASSEDCVFDEGSLNCSFVSEVLPGSMVKLDPKAFRSEQIEKDDKQDDGTIQTSYWSAPKNFARESRLCLFHFGYFQRPDSCFAGRNIKTVRQKAGQRLAELHPVLRADIVVPIRDSGSAAATGYAWQMKKNLDPEALFRPHPTGRSFIEPLKQSRIEGVAKKLRVIPEAFRGKVVVLVDDSIVRGITMQHLIRRLWAAGVKEIHVRIALPPVKFPCSYGIDMRTPGELAWNFCGGDVEKVRAFIGATSLAYLDPVDEKIRAIIETPERHPYVALTRESFCTQCFTGENAVQELEKLECPAV
ncbi:MAG: hypothetical protein HYT22_01010 [Candidatus Niyogibacteria bacterium]|nr:hypothetical protein [Candidatus Niyogibacteria bacterium]